MADKQVIFIVGTQCQPKDDAKFNKWYNEVHIPMLMKSGYVKGVVRYKAIANPGEPAGYIAIYKFRNMQDFKAHEVSPERDAAVKEMRESWGNKVELTSRVQYELLKEW
jgi:antibiotic biosynthesis monooxygenase (ABM) superfamily enzyme